jgi:hypothetical protein
MGRVHRRKVGTRAEEIARCRAQLEQLYDDAERKCQTDMLTDPDADIDPDSIDAVLDYGRRPRQIEETVAVFARWLEVNNIR